MQLLVMHLLLFFELLCLLIELLCEQLFSLVLFDQRFDVLKSPIFLRIRAQTHEVQQQLRLFSRAEHLVLAAGPPINLLLLLNGRHDRLDKLSVVIERCLLSFLLHLRLLLLLHPSRIVHFLGFSLFLLLFL